MNTLILNKPQAEAIYGAMCALNNVAVADGIFIRLPLVVNGEHEFVEVRETDRDVVCVKLSHNDRIEYHAGQSAFASAYKLQ